MKKLMTMIGVAAMAFGLYADGFKYNQTDFADTPLGALDINKNDAGGDTAPFYWSGEAGDSEVKAVSEAEDAAKFLAIDNSEPLYRTVNSGPDAAAQEIGTGVFADMFVKFTASDATEPIVLADGSKLGIWVAADDEAETPTTNLMVCAASLVEGAKAPVATNFTIAVGANFDFTAEHRVTIRAIDEISSGKLGMAGFVIYVDGALVAAADADYADKIGFTEFNTVATPFYANDQLFVSLVKAGTDAAQTITSVGFKGSGELAKVALTDADNAPEFAKPAVDVTIAWDDGVTGFTYQGIATNVDAAGSVVVTLASPSVPVTLSNVTIDTANYVDGGIDAVNLSSSEAGVWTFTAAPASLTMKAAPVAFTIGDEKYATFEDALKAAGSGDPIKLAQSIGGWKHPVVIDDADVDVILDLNGKTLTFDNYLDEDMFEVSAGKLTVIDSGNGGKIAVTVDTESAGFYGVFYCDGDGVIQIGLDEGDNGVTVDGLVGDGLTILKGKFLNIPDEQGKEDIQNFIPGEGEGDYEVVADGNYWKVQKSSPEPTTWTVTYIVDGAVDSTEEVEDQGTPAKVPTPSEKTGYTGAWDEDPTTAVITDNKTFTYTYTANVYKVTFDTGDGEAFADQEYTYGEGDITLNTYEGKLTGYTFGGWTNVVDGGAIIANGGTLDNRIGGYALTAVWEKADEPMPDPIEDPDQKAAYKEWLKNATFAEGKTDAIYADYFAIKLTNTDVSFAGGNVEKAAADKLASIITADMVNQIVAKGFENVDFSALAKEYPNAEFSFVEAKEISAEEGVSGFYRLNVAFKPAND